MNPTDRAMVREAIEKVGENPDLCVTIKPAQWPARQIVPWIEVTAKGMGLHWQSTEDPEQQLRSLVSPLLPGLRIASVLEHAAVNLFFDESPVADQTDFIAGVFLGLYEYDGSERFTIDEHTLTIRRDRILIQNVENGPVWVGHNEEARPFLGRVVRFEPANSDELCFYAALHRFDTLGVFVKTSCYCGSGDNGFVDAENRLKLFISDLGDVVYGDVEIAPFRDPIEGVEFGLVEQSVEDDIRHTRYMLLPEELDVATIATKRTNFSE